MSGDDGERLPGGIPERRAEPRDESGERWRLPRAMPRHFTCVCGKPAWRFPEPGVGFCGFCRASQVDLDERRAEAEERAREIDKEDIDDERQARKDREEAAQ